MLSFHFCSYNIRVGLLFTVALLSFAIVLQDGMAVIAVSLLSAASAITGLSWYWKRSVVSRFRGKRHAPPADMLLKWPNGSFILVRTNGDISRELYMARELCVYEIDGVWYQAIAGLGVIVLIISIIVLSCCEWEMQASIALAYTLMHVLYVYWFAAMLPRSWT